MSSSEDEKPEVHKHGKKHSIVGWLIGIIVLALLGIFIGVKLADNVARSVKVPDDIVRTFKASVYVPKKLPGNYQVMEDSFSLQENVLIFQAKDGAGGTITFTEQLKPENFNFEDFYKQQFKEAKTFSDVPYPSVAGKSTANDSNILSVVANNTWIITTTSSPLTTDNLQVIAKHLEQYKQ